MSDGATSAERGKSGREEPVAESKTTGEPPGLALLCEAGRSRPSGEREAARHGHRPLAREHEPEVCRCTRELGNLNFYVK